MYSVKTFLTRRSARTVSAYARALKRFATFLETDIDNLHRSIEQMSKQELTEKLVQFSDTLGILKTSSQRLTIGAVMSYLSYNDIVIPKSHKTQIIPKKGEFRRDKAFTRADVKHLFDVGQTPLFKTCLLLLFSTGVRSGECCSFKEDDLDGRVIHLKGEYCKNHKSRDVIMTKECADYLYNIWLPMREGYINQSGKRNIGRPKRLDDTRVIPISETFFYEMMTRQISKAGFSEKIDGFKVYHPHSLRKSFRSIGGSVDIDLTETLLGHSGYLNGSYLRFDDILARYDEKLAPLLTISGADPRLQGRVNQLEQELEQQKMMMKTVMAKLLSGDYEKQ